MELWIRSQDREVLMECNQVYYFGINKKHFIVSDLELVQRSYDYQPLGQYKTKERALEVLDEIQDLIKPTLINTEYHSEIKQGIDKLSFDVVMQPVENKITYIQPNVVVYEMPEE